MSLEKILEKIQFDARQKSEAITLKAEDDAARIIAGAEKKAQDESRQVIDKAMRSAQQKSKRMVLSADLALRKEILAEKRAKIQNCYQEAMQKLYQMPDKDYLDIVQKMLIASYTPETPEVIICERDGERIDQRFIDQVNTALRKQGRNGRLSLSAERRNFDGGFILKGERVEIDNSFASILKYQESELDVEIAKILFS
ncbi:MAG: V-type ATP synthase subunit E [bacterium]